MNMGVTEPGLDFLDKLLQSLSVQDPKMIGEAFRDPAFRKNHIELSWFADSIKRACDSYPNKENKSGLVRDEIFRLLTERLSTCTLGFDINTVIALSGEVQENAEVKDYCLVILPFEDCFTLKEDMLITFSEPNQLVFDFCKIHAIRKQLNLSKDGALAVCKDHNTNLFHTVGILAEAAAERYPRFFFSKRLQWEFFFPKTESNCSTCSLSCGSCNYKKPQTPCHLSRVRYERGALMMPFTDLNQEIKKRLDERLRSKNLPDVSGIVNRIASIIKATEECEKGAAIVFSDETTTAAEASYLANCFRGFRLPYPVVLNNPKQVSRMAAIDGALLVDFNGRCHAYGVILDEIAVSPGNSERGARYNCTKSYIEFLHENTYGAVQERCYSPLLIGVVRSEDGIMNIL